VLFVPVVLFVYRAVACSCWVTFSFGNTMTGTSTGHDPGTINERAMLYAHISLLPMLKGDGLGTSPSAWRKKRHVGFQLLSDTLGCSIFRIKYHKLLMAVLLKSKEGLILVLCF
jgi:hypothetical protein